jgi:hypothetical protein
MGMDTALAIFQAECRGFESRRPLRIRKRNLNRGSASFLPQNTHCVQHCVQWEDDPPQSPAVKR